MTTTPEDFIRSKLIDQESKLLWDLFTGPEESSHGIVTLSPEEYRVVEKPVALLEAPRTPQYGRSPLREMYADWWAGKTWSEFYG